MLNVRAAVGLFACACALVIANAMSLAADTAARQEGAASSSSATIWSGVFTDAQAKRGETPYMQHCSQCHAPDLSGATSYDPSPPLVDRPFQLGWDGKSVGDLFAFVALAMPKDDPGSLKPNEYADIIAYVFKANRFPSGATELPANADALRSVAFTLRK